MHDAARLRLRELTQSVYDIGDEVAEYIDNLSEAMADWDTELVGDCALELREAVAGGRTEVRVALAELNGLRQAFVSGIRSGSLSASLSANAVIDDHPGRTLSFLRNQQVVPVEQAPAPVVSTATLRLTLRKHNTEVIDQLTELAEWVVEQTRCAIEEQSVLLPQALARAEKHALELVDTWNATVVGDHPALVTELRGEAPPRFLAERARVEQIVGKIRSRRAAAQQTG
ncbi:MAG: hypothetical protein L0J74_00500 [Corynebacterium sp.]|uniref:Uncharacterized protein n=1 Tax=Candidatus Corynebacterium faecigallinarum TaxID=2838528 RepID=A0A9D2QIH4_9CORY|nr:hypothetical protein [Corynebacterium sp.]HJC86147.1 hypothetical protein [Candidatus Corynebacterium faecigallinarum]MDN5722636.1 hypothetical protein [Corynebacterium sp.]MDN6282083.1 hypothetical protein [Corynebacterium sp.]MDN6304282.1 hypothetical protein [Corynebacterium sp.]MDN6353079.1 hypothetical protein [Corynebacterium sp.]